MDEELYTSIEQSKKLLGLGLSPKSADKCWCTAVKGRPQVVENQGYNEYGDFEIPCWGVGSLIKVMPDIILTKEGPTYGFGHPDSSHITESNSIIEAAYNMVVWLLENGYIGINNQENIA